MTKDDRPTIALIYDFDGTLSPTNMQEFGLIQDLADDIDLFWRDNSRMATDNDADDVLCYLYRLTEAARRKGIALTRDKLRSYGQRIELYHGVAEWFELVNSYGAQLGLDVHHYVISSGLKEMIEGTAIAPHFDNIFACSYLYDGQGLPLWPAVAVDYTAKTQFLFKINKGISEVSDSQRVNRYVPYDERPVPMSHMIYFGDGETDVPCMKLVRERGGHSIAVYGNERRQHLATQLLRDGRVDVACAADYSATGDIYRIVCAILRKLRTTLDFDTLLHEQNAPLLR